MARKKPILGEENKPETEEEPDPTEIEVEPEEDAEDDEPEEPAADAASATRRAKRQKRLQDLRAEDEKKVQERIQAADTARREAEAQAAYFRGHAEAAHARTQTQPEDPDDQEVKRARNRKLELQTVFDRMSPEEQTAKKAEMDQAWFAEDEAEKVAITRREIRRSGAGQRVDPMAGVRNVWIQKHAGDILQAPQQVRNVGILQLRSLLERGYPETEETYALAAQKTRQEFPDIFPQQRSPAKPRSTMQSIRSSGGAPQTSERKTVRMNEKLIGLARATYPKLSKEQAIKQWAKDHQKYLDTHPEEDG